jgi:hypothetical protein
METVYQKVCCAPVNDDAVRESRKLEERLMKPLKILAILIGLITLCCINALAASTDPPIVSNISVVNNLTGALDTVTVGGLHTDDIVKVYSSDTNPVPVGIAVASGSSVTVYISQLGTNAGTAFVSVTSAPDSESFRTEAPYTAEPRTSAPDPLDITAVNNAAGLLDTLTVTGVANGDIVRAYATSVGTSVLATAVGSGATATLYFNQLGINAGTVYVSVQGAGELESTRTAVSYITEITSPLAVSAVTVTNTFYREIAGVQVSGTEDKVSVAGVVEDDVITVYKASTGPDKWVPPVTVAADGIVDIDIPQLGTKAGKVYVTITKPGKSESKMTAVSYLAEPATPPPLAANISVTNNYGIPDQITLTHVTPGYIVNVYKTTAIVTPFASDTAAGDTVTLALSTTDLDHTGGKIYVTFTAPDANESTRLTVTYVKEVAAVAPLSSDISVANNYNAADVVTVEALKSGDVVKVYLAATGTTTAYSGSPASGSATATITIPAGTLSAGGGRIYVSVTSTDAGESTKTVVTYNKESFSNAPAVTAVTVVNNFNAPDTVRVGGLAASDVVTVYQTATGTTSIGSGSPAAGDTFVLITLPTGKLSPSGGKLYITVKAPTANESARTAVSYLKELQTTVLPATAVTVTNYAAIADIIRVDGLSAGDTVKVYPTQTGTSTIGTGSPLTGDTFVSMTIPAGTLSAAGGKIYVTVASATAAESNRTMVSYASEKTTPIPAIDVIVVNNYYYETGGVQASESQDDVTIKDVLKDDIITIYKAAAGTDMLLFPMTVTADGDVQIHIGQLGTAAGKIYVAITSVNKTESPRTPVPYSAEPTTTALLPAAIMVQNNYQFDDTITITGIVPGQTVAIYTTQTGVPAIVTATPTVSTVKFTIDNGVLAAAGGKVYVTVTDPGKLESTRTPQSYTPETSSAPARSNIIVVNYSGSTMDTVTIIGLSPGDTVTVYTAGSGGDILAAETVTDKGTTMTLTARLKDAGGTIYITVTGAGKAESKRTPVTYDAS